MIHLCRICDQTFRTSQGLAAHKGKMHGIHNGMRIITINLPEKYLDALTVLQSKNIIANRSEGLRQALRDFLEKEVEFPSELENLEKYLKVSKYV